MAWGIGIGAGATNLVSPDEPAFTAAMWAILGLGSVVAAFGLVGVVQSVTGRMDREQWRSGIAAFVVFAGVMAPGFFLPPGPARSLEALGFPATPTLAPGAFVATLFFAAGWAGAFVLARWASQPGARDRAQAALFSSCLVLYPAAITTQFFASGLQFGYWIASGSMVAAVCVSVAWLASPRHDDRRIRRAAAWAPLAIVALGLLAGSNGVGWVGGASRIAMTALAAFAILRYHAFGIHAQLRFGISKGAVAGIVVAVVFVVSEGAQSLFEGDQDWLGLAVGGLVVFAIAPIQRAADRFAEKAVPVAHAVAGRNAPESIYWEAFQAASRDGTVTPREELHLARIADQLGIGAERALQLRGPERRRKR